jgi:hypothetical protein
MYHLFLAYLSKHKTVFKLGVVVFLVNCALCVAFRLYTPQNQIASQLLNGNDAKGYYAYLPWLVHQYDINFENGYSYPINQQRVLKYPYGTALCQLPFYIISQPFVSHSLNLEQLSRKEMAVICLSSSLYLALALMLLFKLLSLFFDDAKLKLLTVCIVYIATNLLYYTVIENVMSHVYSFFSITGFLYSIFSFYYHKQNKHLYWGLFFLFLIIALRPSNGIVALLILFFTAYQLKNFKIVVFAVITIIGSYCIQVLLWKWQCGQWIFSSYKGEGFNWMQPQLIAVLFGFRKGLFIYTPILILAVVGLIVMYKKHKQLIVISTTVSLVFLYLIASWWHWPFGDSFGHRAFIDVYAFAGIGIAGLFSTLTSRIVKMSTLVFTLFCFVLNGIQTWQVRQGILALDYMNAKKYAYQFLYLDDASRNLLGGENAIFPYHKKYTMQQDSLPLMDMDFKEFSAPINFTTTSLNTGTYLEVEFTKLELEAFESKQARVYVELVDSTKKSLTFSSFLLNETPHDYETINTKKYNYQIIMPQLLKHQQLQVFINN